MKHGVLEKAWSMACMLGGLREQGETIPSEDCKCWAVWAWTEGICVGLMGCREKDGIPVGLLTALEEGI